MGHAIQPVADQLPRHDRCRLANQDSESGLEGVFGIVIVVEDAPADTEDHRTVAAQQDFKRVFVPALDEPLQELSIGKPRSILAKRRAAKVLYDPVERVGRHCWSFLAGSD